MNTNFDKRTKILIMTAVLGLFVLVVIIVGVFLFQKKEVAPEDSDAAVEQVVSEWRAKDIWKQQPSSTETFIAPSGFKKGTVKIEAQWGWSGADCIIQVNETHEVSVPGLNKTITMSDIGDWTEQAKCTNEIKELTDLGFPPGPFNLPHVVDTDDSTWFPKPGKSITGDWDTAVNGNNLTINLKFTGMDGPPEVLCHTQNGTKRNDLICNGSHKYRVRVIWNAVSDTPIPSNTPTPTPSPTPTMTPTATPTLTPSPTPEPLKANLGDFVWIDSNRNGKQDVGELGLEGVKVDLFSENGTSPLLTTTSDQEGKYSFRNISAGKYYLVFANISGFSRTGVNLGPDDKDSDADPKTGKTTLITLEAGQTDNDWDAGYYKMNPSIQIIKSEIADHANAKDFQIIPNTGTAVFHIKVTNTGEVDLKNVVVTDAMAPGCARNISTTDLTTPPVGVLEVGKSVSYSCQRSGVTESFKNIATVVADPVEGGTQVSDDDDSVVTIAGTPAIRIEKSEQEDHSIAEDTQTVEKGESAVFYITVTNVGAVGLKEVKVTDELAPLCGKDITNPLVLPVGESVSYECTLDKVQSSFVNIAEVSGKSVDTDEVVTDQDPSKVVVPGNIVIARNVSMVCQTDVSSTVTYSITLTNPTADSRVLDVTESLDDGIDGDMLVISSISAGGIYDAGSNEITWSDVSLEPNGTKTFTYVVNVQSADFGEFENTVVVEQDGVEVGRSTETVNVLCLPATGILGDNTNRIIVPVVAVLLGVMFIIFKGHIYVGRLFIKEKRGRRILNQ